MVIRIIACAVVAQVMLALAAKESSAAGQPGPAQAPATAAPVPPPDAQSRVDELFARWQTMESPGCAMGVSLAGAPLLRRAYGMADLEQERLNTVDTIFEAGSVAKQFTAAAVLLLAQQGRLSLDDPVRRHFPELPDYGTPLLVRHLLTHTSGLRDWGAVVSIAGWPRGSRAFTQAHVLDVIARQQALNYPPGARYSYTNSGYNLAAMLVARVSGQSFADFTRQQIFEPLGMTHTGWRDDYRRVVKGRATAYSPTEAGWRLDMPAENAHGNGGLLTTVADLLVWNENFVKLRVGGVALAEAQLLQGVLTSGETIRYAAGLVVDSWRGVRVVGHDGATAGYRASLARFPEPQLSVAVLCNAGSANAADLQRKVAEIFLAGRLAPPSPPSEVPLDAGVLATRAGLYLSDVSHATLRLVVTDGKLRIENGPALALSSPSSFLLGSTHGEFTVAAQGGITALRLASLDGPTESWRRVEPVTPAREQLAAYLGRYRSEEAEAELVAVLENDRLVLRQRPDSAFVLRPTYADAFVWERGDVRFLRDPRGGVLGLAISGGRLWDLRFQRVEADSPR